MTDGPDEDRTGRDRANPASAARVLVALDGARPDESAMRTLTAMVSHQAVELTALYVEDEDVLRAAALPGALEVSLSGAQSTLDPRRLAEDMARDASAVRQAFEIMARHIAERHDRLRHRFVVARGRLTDEISRAAAQADVVMVARAVRLTGLRPRLAPAFIDLVHQPRHVLFVNEPWLTGSSIVTLGGSQAALDYAARLAEVENLRLVIAAPPGQQAEPPPGVPVRQLASSEAQAVAELCLKEDARLLVVPALPGVEVHALLVSLMDRLPCSLMKLAFA